MSKTRNSLLEEAFLDAKLVKQTALENAKNSIVETLSPKLNSIFAQKVQEMEDETNLDETDLDSEVENLFEDDSDSDEFNLDEMSAEELESFIEDVVSNMISSGEISNPEDEDLEIEDEVDAEDEDLEIEAEDETEDFEIEAEDEDDAEVDLNELLMEIEKYNSRKQRTNMVNHKKSRRVSEILSERESRQNKTSNVDNKLKHEISVLKESLNEVKLLNAKLLYSNKILISKNLTESQKKKVIIAFDKIKNVSDAKIVFESINSTITKDENVRPRNFASNTIAPKQINESKDSGIIDADPMVQRFQKLAGIIK